MLVELLERADAGVETDPLEGTAVLDNRTLTVPVVLELCKEVTEVDI